MINWKFIKLFGSVFFLALVLGACFQSDYTKLVKAELGKGVRFDSLLFEINFGTTRQEFFGRCFDLNKQHLITQGPSGGTVQYLFTDSLVHDSTVNMSMLFIPAYDEADKIIEMNLEFSYPGWAPWNRNLQADVLKQKVLGILMRWYGGNEFVDAKINKTDIPVKVDGNRRMIVYIKDPRNVVVKIQDLTHPKYRHSITPSGTP